MKSRGDKSKGFAYVEFVEGADIAKALELDRVALEGRPMYISKCNRNNSENKAKLKVPN